MAISQSQKAAKQKVLDLQSKMLAAKYKAQQEKDKAAAYAQQLKEHKAAMK